MTFEPLSDDDYRAVHDVIVEVFDLRLVKLGGDVTLEIAQRIVDACPRHMKFSAAEWGWGDTEARDNLYVWLRDLDFQLLEVIVRGPAVPATSPAPKEENRGPGSPYARFIWLMDQLDKRFPDPEPFSASAPEHRYLAAMDKLLGPPVYGDTRNAFQPPKMSAQKTPVITIEHDDNEEWVKIKLDKSQIAEASYDAHGSDGMRLAEQIATAIADKMKWTVVYK